MADIAVLTAFLVARTFLSIYMASVNGGIVNAIVDRNLSLFIQRVNLTLVRL
jgi:ATP-binding cassette subfamily D (ALD) protein 3